MKTTSGTVVIRRPYLYCKKCEKHNFPKETSALQAGRLSPKLTADVCLLAHQVPFQQASDILERIANVKVSTSTIKVISEQVGKFLFEEEKEKSLAKPNPQKLFEKEFPQERCYLQVDGAMLPGVKGFHENKLAILYKQSDIIEKGEGEKHRSTILKKDFVSSFHLGVEDFGQRLKYNLLETGISFAPKIITISDGAVWIENLVKDLIPNGIHILDWFHAKEKLWECGKELFGEKSPKVAPWVKKYADKLWEGKVDKLLKEILAEAKSTKKSTPLFDLYKYFAPRKKMLQYKKFRDKGYYIGSGAIESANSYVMQDRFKRSGMKWTDDGLNAVGKLRTIYLSGRWNEYWGATAA